LQYWYYILAYYRNPCLDDNPILSLNSMELYKISLKLNKILTRIAILLNKWRSARDTTKNQYACP
jgi:hypothetical protein